MIDEYGLHDRHEKHLEMVASFCIAVIDDMKSTLLIFNFTVQNMQRDLGVRLWSRLHENHLIVQYRVIGMTDGLANQPLFS